MSDVTATVASITVDCVDALVVGTFWSAVLGRALDEGASSEFAAIDFAGRRDAAGWAPLGPGDQPTWLFVRVPEPKTAKNRMHLDVAAADVEAEVGRLVELGATRVGDVDEFGYAWTVMADPEGNEFCLAATR
ncbi:VOC family protein [Nocardioides conyzicola]|uniref:VOC family protein n=1 Tax=Nocardioides conyzicola TaxID=1651781 RepID=A0ABP8X0Q0_9ACTN